jgi:twitching motility two-component system response regulator PilH
MNMDAVKGKNMARILVVDDSKTQLESISRMLTKHGHEILTAKDGETAVDSANINQPDLILMDVVMPGLNGFQATRQISNNAVTSHIPVIILTSKDQDTDKIWAKRQGAKDYIVKPAEEKELIGKIDAILVN